MSETAYTVGASGTPQGIEHLYAGADWLSCTLPLGAAGYWSWCDTGRRLIERIAGEGYELQARSMNGYRGLGAGGSFFGHRDDGAYLQLSGHYAGDHLDAVYRDDLHTSRLDVQVTVRYVTMPSDLGVSVYRAAVDANENIPSSRRRRVWYMSGSDGGYTVYIGAPTSEQRGKVYNKEVQSEQPEYSRCWRYEVTYKNAYATQWLAIIFEANGGRARLCAQAVSNWFLGRGVACYWWSNDAPIPQPLIKEAPSDADGRLRWLRMQVRPALHWLIANGSERQAMVALGLLEDNAVNEWEL